MGSRHCEIFGRRYLPAVCRAILPLLIVLGGCADPMPSTITQRDLVGDYQGIGYYGQGLRPGAVSMHIFADGTFSGELGVFDGFRRHTGHWKLGKFDVRNECRNVDFIVRGAFAGRYCFSIGNDEITGIDCYSDHRGLKKCLMRRHVDKQTPNTFDFSPNSDGSGS